ncbi:DUF547 domain-containing protein [Pseudoalteromonas sp. S1727]|uniref:DUF547 domain-containing protein n=1 Tax=Pseudoalteromonas sp. S1727 TaxID=2066514 RepID=UPI0011083306|nr:DUF547 domain-containing protein [Pseudoalteromonas sp. S1727]TMN71013.1 DUF547 domain-containing protein [Pseudoalteromonas sp. S1727]
MKYLMMLLLFCLAFSTQANDELHQPWQQLLNEHVKPINHGASTVVDYAAIKQQHSELKSYLASLSAITATQFASWNNLKQLAFLINAYNAWTVELILTEYPQVKSIKDLGSFFSSPWSKEFVSLLGETRSLDNIEHTLIRGNNKYREPRIHFAVNCASIGCPALREEAYTGAKLDAQLEQQTTRFLADTTRNYAKDNTLYLSSIFKWYQTDFATDFRGAQSLSAFTLLYSDALNLTPSQHAKLESNTMKIKFLDYNWALNDNQ